MAHLKARVEKREEGLYGRYGFVKPADFFKEYLRLSAILARTRAAEEPPTPSALWLNSQSKHPLSKELKNALQRTF